MTISKRPRILFIDAYDSFSNNIISLLETSVDAEVSSIKIDIIIHDLAFFLKGFDAVVAGPGPGDPRIAKDVGLFHEIWQLEGVDVIPVLGICLGFQSLVLTFGGKIERLAEPRHGIVRKVSSTEESIFRGVPLLYTVQYHSLHAILGCQNHAVREQENGERLDDTDASGHLIPIAWDEVMNNEGMQEAHISQQNPESILMAVKHKTKPFYGIQFHPESVCSSVEARRVVGNWWNEVRIWTAETSRGQTSLLSGLAPCCQDRVDITSLMGTVDSGESQHQLDDEPDSISSMIHQDSLTVPNICELVGANRGNSVIFDSEKRQTAETGAFSIIGIVENESLRFEYKTGRPEVWQILDGKPSPIDLKSYGGNAFNFFEAFMEKRKVKNGQPGIPFWGGLMGYIAYEACLETLRVSNSARIDSSPRRPDVGFVFIERSIVVDHVNQTVHVQSLKPSDHSWIDTISSLLSNHQPIAKNLSLKSPMDARISFPDEEGYKSRIRACQEAIRRGDSYELCLTNQINVNTLSRLPSWSMYNRLRNVNPAPFGAYVRLGELTILSSSPERFMRWSRPTISKRNQDQGLQSSSTKTSILQFRPIKGTVARRATPSSVPRSLHEATKMLSTQKEQAENLMIVDLIRHDLHGVAGSGQVTVPKLMVVEEYETVFQLVSVIEGEMVVRPRKEGSGERSREQTDFDGSHTDPFNRRHGSCDDSSSKAAPKSITHLSKRVGQRELKLASGSQSKPSTPLGALPATLPPGSMTGAPKLRSCQILQALEDSPRGIYSGVIGYIDVGGGGDWSVAIRCAVRWDSPANATGDHWTVGAGGAVTALSTEEGEWQEMLAKLQATLRIFHD